MSNQALPAYSYLSPLARARLAASEPKRYQTLRAEHYQRIATLERELVTAVHVAERRKICATLETLKQPGTLHQLPAVRSNATPSELADAAMQAAYAARPHLRPRSSGDAA